METGGPNPTRLYTRTGDEGETGLVGGRRIGKDHPRIRAFGTLDELGAHLGLVAAHVPASEEELARLLLRLQHELFVAQSELAVAPGAPPLPHRIEGGHVARLEGEIDRYTAAIDPVRSFVLPRGTVLAAEIHVARAVARRAEREVYELHRTEPVRPELRHWINRVSDLLFALALYANERAGFVETPPDYSV